MLRNATATAGDALRRDVHDVTCAQRDVRRGSERSPQRTDQRVGLVYRQSTVLSERPPCTNRAR